MGDAEARQNARRPHVDDGGDGHYSGGDGRVVSTPVRAAVNICGPRLKACAQQYAHRHTEGDTIETQGERDKQKSADVL